MKGLNYTNIQGLCDNPLSPTELNQLATEVPPGKIKDLAESLEMTRHLTSEDHTDLQKVLGRWTKEMRGMDTSDLRAHLVHYLRIADLQELAEK